MKHLKQFALAAAVMLVAALGVGAGSASATEFCSTNTSPCTGTMYGPGTKLSGKLTTGKSAVLTNSLDPVTCREGTINGEMTSTGGSGSTPISGKVSSVAWTNCIDSFGNACTASAQGLPWSLTGEKTGTSTFNVVVSGSPGVQVICSGGLLNCTFSQTSLTLTGVNGAPARVTATAVGLNTSGGFCPKTASYDAEYDVTAPNPLYAV
jgi:hypothetical protein